MFKSKLWARCGAFIFTLMASGVAMGQEVATPFNGADIAWLITATALVLLMTIPGLALFYGGMVRKVNFLSTLMKCFATCSMVSILWVVIGYSLAFTPGGDYSAYIGDLSRLFLDGLGVETKASADATIPESLFMIFQMTFAIITPALIAGSFAGRMRFSAMLLFMGAWVLLVYAPVAHWVWGGGFLGQDGVLDFAGGTVVHINAGIAALIAAVVVGPRYSFKNPKVNQPNNLALSLVGASLLWVGWFGFNGGSALASNATAVMAIVVTQIAAAAAALSWMALEWLKKGKPSVVGKISGAVAGLVVITPAAGFVSPMSALIMGLIAGAACFVSSYLLHEKFGLDDLDAFSVHGVGGILGAVLTGVFASAAFGGTSGWIEGNFDQVMVQLESVGITIAYSAIVTYLIIRVVGLITPLRVTPKVEREGLDASLHGETVA